MTITIDLRPEQERRLAERATQAGQDIATYVHHLIDRDIGTESFDTVLAPVRRDFEESGMTDDDLAALVDEAREDIWRETQAKEEGLIPSARPVVERLRRSGMYLSDEVIREVLAQVGE